MRVFVTGGSGLVGSRLLKALLDRGDVPVLLTRRPDAVKKSLDARVEVVQGDPMKPGPWQATLADCDGVVNLVGEGVFNKRWTPEFKKTLVESRTVTTHHVAEAIGRKPRRADRSPKPLVSASAIGWYGPHGDEPLAEDAPPAKDFMGDLCVQWEKAAEAAAYAGARVTLLRIGIVLDKKGGALAKLLLPFKMCAGGPVASGKQVMSWIHHADLVGLILFALDNPSVSGPLNGTAPNPVSNTDFGKALGKALGRPSFVWTPGFALKLALGEAADIVVNGQRVLPKKALDRGYVFKYPKLDEALASIVKE